MASPQKTNITLAVESDTINTLKQEAQTHNTSVNARVNRILSDYAVFGRYFAQKKPIMIAPQIFEHLLDAVDDQVWLESWEITFSEVIPQVFELSGLDCTLENLAGHVIGNIGIKMGAFDRISYDHDQSEKAAYLVLVHRYNTKWSRILACVLSNLLESKFKCIVKQEISSNAVRIIINQKR
jgi:hypothetical protein